MKKRILSTILTICMVLTLLPISALAEFSLVDGAIQGQVFGAASGAEGPVGETVNVAVYAQDNPDTALTTCTTNAEGVFTLTKDGGFPAGNYTVVLTSNLYLTERREISIPSGNSGYTFARIDLAVLGKVYGTVTDAATGAALSDVKVEAYRDSALIASTTTDASGAYSLEGERGSCQLVLTKDGYNSKTIDTKLSGPLSWELVDVQMISTGSGTSGGGSGEEGGGPGDKAEIIASGTCGDTLTWTLDSNGILTISGVGDMSNYYPSPWYSYRNSIRSLIIENGITSIGDSAFRNCGSLTSIEIPAGVIYIGDFAFSECNNLIDVTISTGTTSIGNYAFSDCLNLASVSIPDTVAHLGSFAFHQCHSLASITIPSKVTCIEKETFSYCYSLSNITLPDSIMCIKDSAFYHCRSLSNITIPTGVTSIEDFTFFECASLTNITIPVGVSNIGNSSFRGCSNLSTIVVPDTLTNIGDYAFTGCMSLSDVYFGGNVEHWGSLVNFRGSELTGATIHYNSTGPEDSGENPNHFYETRNPVTDTKSLLNSYVEDWNAAYTKYVEAVDKALQAFASDSAPNRDEVIQSQKLAMMEADSRAGSRDSRYISGSVFPDDETKDAAYEALSTFLYDHIYSAIDLSNISAEDINGAKLVNTVLNGIRSDSETYQIGHVKVAITTSGFGSVSFGMLTCTSQRVAGLYTYGICSSTAKCEQAIRAYMRELVGLENSAIYQVYSAVCKDVLGQSLDKLTQNYLKTKLQPLLSKLPPKVGSLMVDLNSCYNYYQYVKKMMGWAGSADTPENILAAMQGIEFKDESIQDRSVKKAWKTLKKASSALNDAYMCYLSGTLDESKIATWWNSTVDWWSGKVTSLKAIFTCPVNVSVYDSSGREIGYVGDDDIWYTDGLIYIEEKGDAKIVYSFTDDLISFQVSATDYGALGCCIEQYDENGRPIGRTNYYDIGLDPGKNLSVLGSQNGENVSYKITAGNNVIDADEYILSNQNAAISVHCSAETGGAAYGAGTYVRGDAVVLLAEPGDNYRFIGWYQNDDLMYTSRIYEFTAKEDVSLKAIFRPDTNGEIENSYAITFDANGGTISGSATLTTGADSKLPNLPTATRSGYTFNGWYTTTSGGEKITTDYIFTSDTTVYAHWTKNSGGSSGGSSTGGGSSSGGSGSTSYSITAGNFTHGSVSVSPKSASKGTKVTLTIQPDSGYALENLVVKDNKGNAIGLTKESNTKYAFTMPNSKVTVDATFTEIEQRPSGQIGFTDVSPDAYYYDAVAWAVEQGITSGTSATTFSPDASCTRAQMVTFLWRAAGSPAPRDGANPFSDVQTGTYYYNAVRWAAEQGITVGASVTTFSPDSAVTRGQTVAFLYRTAGSPAVSGSVPFADVPAGAFYADAVQWAANKDVTSGTSATTFSPSDNCTRAQIVTFLYRAR